MDLLRENPPQEGSLSSNFVRNFKEKLKEIPGQKAVEVEILKNLGMIWETSKNL